MLKSLKILVITIATAGCTPAVESEWKRLCKEMQWQSCDRRPTLAKLRVEILPLVEQHEDVERTTRVLNQGLAPRIKASDLQAIKDSNAFSISRARLWSDFIDREVKTSGLVIHPPQCFSFDKSELESCKQYGVRALDAQILIDGSTAAGLRLLADVRSHPLTAYCGSSVLGHLRLVERRNDTGESLGRVGWWLVKHYSPERCEPRVFAERIANQVSSSVFRRVIAVRRDDTEKHVEWESFITSEIEDKLASASRDRQIAR